VLHVCSNIEAANRYLLPVFKDAKVLKRQISEERSRVHFVFEVLSYNIKEHQLGLESECRLYGFGRFCL